MLAVGLAMCMIVFMYFWYLVRVHVLDCCSIHIWQMSTLMLTVWKETHEMLFIINPKLWLLCNWCEWSKLLVDWYRQCILSMHVLWVGEVIKWQVYTEPETSIVTIVKPPEYQMWKEIQWWYDPLYKWGFQCGNSLHLPQMKFQN